MMFFTFFYNLNATEVWDSDFKNAFTGIFNFTVGILSFGLNSARDCRRTCRMTFATYLNMAYLLLVGNMANLYMEVHLRSNLRSKSHPHTYVMY